MLIAISALTGVVAAEEIVSGSDVDVWIASETVDVDGQTAVVWSSDPVTVLVGPTASRGGDHYIYCLDVDGEEYDCQQGELPDNEGFPFELSAQTLSSGEHRLTARIHEDGWGYNNPQIEAVSFTVLVLTKSGDLDNDGLSNAYELSLGTEYQDRDSDGDGLHDGAEVNQYSTNPQQVDTDGDGLDDYAEINRVRTNPNRQDTDSDGLDDEREVNDYGTDPNRPQTDSDGLSDGDEVNRYGTNPTRSDTDGDGLDDGDEVNRYGTNPTRSDTDGDGLNDGQEVSQGTDPTDADSPRDEEPDEPAQGETQDASTRDVAETTDSDESTASGEQAGDDSAHRGFLTNDVDSSWAVLNDPFNITAIGFALSIVGILLELGRGR